MLDCTFLLKTSSQFSITKPKMIYFQMLSSKKSCTPFYNQREENHTFQQCTHHKIPNSFQVYLAHMKVEILRCESNIGKMARIKLRKHTVATTMKASLDLTHSLSLFFCCIFLFRCSYVDTFIPFSFKIFWNDK